MSETTPSRLPHKVEIDPRFESIKNVLSRDVLLLWQDGQKAVPHIDFTSALQQALITAKGNHKVEFGIERIEVILSKEKKGLDALKAKQLAQPTANRVSRLLIISNDGSERFYRAAEAIAIKYSERLLCLYVDATAEQLGANMYDEEKEIKALLVIDREAVIDTLYSLGTIETT